MDEYAPLPVLEHRSVYRAVALAHTPAAAGGQLMEQMVPANDVGPKV